MLPIRTYSLVGSFRQQSENTFLISSPQLLANIFMYSDPLFSEPNLRWPRIN